MSILGVTTILTLAATTALPFTPPAGWSRVSSPTVKAQINQGWQSPPLPLANGKHAAFATAVFPWNGSLEMLARHGTSTEVCGNPARLLSYRSGGGTNISVSHQIIVAKGGYATTLLYTRPITTAPDIQVEQMMRSVCPTGTASLPPLHLPKGWTERNGDFAVETLGAWVGRQPGHVMTLGRTSANVSLEKLADQLKVSVSSSSAKDYLRNFKQQPTTFCGHPGLIVSMDMAIPSLPMVIEQAVTQSGGFSYMLGYVHPASVSPDSAAEASLRGLCATTASPQR